MKIDLSLAGPAAPAGSLQEALKARTILESGTGPGAEMRGWLELPETPESLVKEIESAAKTIRGSDALVVVGIGGSFQGASALIDAVKPPFGDSFPVHFAGCHLDAVYHEALLGHLSGKRYAVNVISKSGTTLEPALAFELLWRDLSSRLAPDEIRDLVFATTGPETGLLREFANKHNLPSFPIREDVGGRYSVLSPVGLLPLAAAGLDVRALLDGAGEMAKLVRSEDNQTLEGNPALAYAAYRIGARKAGKQLEVMAAVSPSLLGISEWWKQLYGESEGKDGTGVFPSCLFYPTDLHSLGQWLQDGPPIAFETALDMANAGELTMPEGNDDSLLGDMGGRSLHDVNRTVMEGALRAHSAEDTPCARIELSHICERELGALVFMFEYACALSAYAQGVNPFDQPGVEGYKKEARRLLGK